MDKIEQTLIATTSLELFACGLLFGTAYLGLGLVFLVAVIATILYIFLKRITIFSPVE